MTKARASAHGFTLIEIMMVAAMIGVLSSVAIPEFARVNLRARTAERRGMITGIARAMMDFKVNNSLPGGTLTGVWNPPGVPRPSKRAFVASQAGWNQLPLSIEGEVYYSYKFVADDTVAPPTLVVWATGDLDGDGSQSPKQVSYVGLGQNSYTWSAEDPAEGAEDVGTF